VCACVASLDHGCDALQTASITSPSPRWSLRALHILSAAALQVRLCGRACLLFPSDARIVSKATSKSHVLQYAAALRCGPCYRAGTYSRTPLGTLDLILAPYVSWSIREETWYWLPRSIRYRVGGFLSRGEALAGGVAVTLNLARACILAKRLAHLKHQKRAARSNSITLAARLAFVSSGP
jgi:hypothetical protein